MSQCRLEQPRDPRRTRRLRGGVVLLSHAAVAISAAGCASITYTDAHHVQHLVGWVDLALPPGTSETRATSTTTLGLAVVANGAGSRQVSLGFARDTIVTVPSGACLDLQQPGPCAARQSAPDHDPRVF